MSNYPIVLNSNFSTRANVIGLAENANDLICGASSGITPGLQNISNADTGSLLFSTDTGYVPLVGTNNSIFQMTDGAAENKTDITVTGINFESSAHNISKSSDDIVITTSGDLMIGDDTAVSVNYVDALMDGINVKMECKVMFSGTTLTGDSDTTYSKFYKFVNGSNAIEETTGTYSDDGVTKNGIINITGFLIKPASGGQELLELNDRVLVNVSSESNVGSQMNGIYIYTTSGNNSVLTRAPDADEPDQSIFTGMFTNVTLGNMTDTNGAVANSNSGYVLTTNQTDNGDPFTFTKFSGFNVGVPISSSYLVMSDVDGSNNLKNSGISTADGDLTVAYLSVNNTANAKSKTVVSNMTNNMISVAKLSNGVGEITIGYVSDDNSVAFGTSSSATISSVALGVSTTANDNSISIGHYASSYYTMSNNKIQSQNIAIGGGYSTSYKADASGNSSNSTALGSNTSALFAGAIAIGGTWDGTYNYNANAGAANSIAIGVNSITSEYSTYSETIGTGAYSNATNNIAILSDNYSANSLSILNYNQQNNNNTATYPCSVLPNDTGSNDGYDNFINNTCRLVNLSVPVFATATDKIIMTPAATNSTMLCMKDITIIGLDSGVDNLAANQATFTVSGSNTFNSGNPSDYIPIITSLAVDLAQFETKKILNLTGAYTSFKITSNTLTSGKFQVMISGILFEMNSKFTDQT